MTMANGLVVSKLPGYLDLGTSQNTWGFHNWNWDCEGYGNARFQNHGSFYGNSGGFGIDIGADELGQLVAVGYRFGTTHFMEVAPNLTNVKIMDNKYLWFLGPRTGMSLGGGNTVPAPTNKWGPHFRGIDHIVPRPAKYIWGAPTSYYPPWFSAWSFTNSTGYYGPTFADITPHLLDDLHPWWAGLIFVPSNPIWQECNSLYNPWLYSDPSTGRINPTGSYKGDIGGANNYQWLDATWTVTPTPAINLIQWFGLRVTFRASPLGRHEAYDAWGRARMTLTTAPVVDTFKPTYTGSNMVALRYALESWKTPPFTSLLTDTNLQSFMVLVKPTK